jgi:hypothetical protein
MSSETTDSADNQSLENEENKKVFFFFFFFVMCSRVLREKEQEQLLDAKVDLIVILG